MQSLQNEKAYPQTNTAARKASVHSLQELYAIVIGLAIVHGLGAVFGEAVKQHTLPNLNGVLVFIAFIVTVVPFYHGANRYLEVAYCENEEPAIHCGLLIDFSALLLEGILFYLLVLYSGSMSIFYTLLAGLFIFDAVWVGITRLIVNHAKEDSRVEYAKWAVTNVVAASILYLLVWTTLFADETTKGVACLAVCLFRTVYDYYSVWPFYYPPNSHTSFSDIPAPRPGWVRTAVTMDH